MENKDLLKMKKEDLIAEVIHLRLLNSQSTTQLSMEILKLQNDVKEQNKVIFDLFGMVEVERDRADYFYGKYKDCFIK